MQDNQQAPKDNQSNPKRQKELNALSQEQLMKIVIKLQNQNKRLKNRLADHQPFKQKILRTSNQQKLQKLFQKYQVRKYALKVCYLGMNYDGMSCVNQGDNTVEQYIFKVMHTLSLTRQSFPADESFTRAGRTDKGVSAMGNVIALNLRTDIQKGNTQKIHSTIKYCNMMNSLLPQDIRIIGCQEVKPQFNARYWCTKRRYKYFFAKNNLNMQAIKEAIKYFQGTHNFINFCKMNITNTVNFTRTIFSAQVVKVQSNQILEQGDDRNQIYYFYFIGNSFLWHQIRFMSAILFLIGSGKQSPNIIKQLMDREKYPTKPNYHMAPDYPLILQDCQYDDLSFAQTDPAIIYSFYNTFYQMVMKKSIEKVMLINCMIMARQQLLVAGKLTKEVFVSAVLEKNNHQKSKGKKMEMHKSSGRGLQQAIQCLKGKKLDLYQKKKEKQEKYQQTLKIETQNKEKGQNQNKQEIKHQKIQKNIHQSQ